MSTGILNNVKEYTDAKHRIIAETSRVNMLLVRFSTHHNRQWFHDPNDNPMIWLEYITNTSTLLTYLLSNMFVSFKSLDL